MVISHVDSLTYIMDNHTLHSPTLKFNFFPVIRLMFTVLKMFPLKVADLNEIYNLHHKRILVCTMNRF